MWLLILLLLAVVFIIIATTKLNLHPFLALLIAAFGYGILCGKMSLEQIVESVNAGFGGTIGYIGIVILAGAIIGTFLEKSGILSASRCFVIRPSSSFVLWPKRCRAK
jgi:GntP family gluconate:H+ symporter